MPPRRSTLPIFYLEFPTQYLAASTFLRFQEHHESPRFSGKSFSLETYMDWYAMGHGSFSYYTDRTGFNIPSSVLTPFRQGVLGRLSMKERALLHTLPAMADPYYIVASYKGVTPGTLAHEIVHGHFHLSSAYADAVQDTLALKKNVVGAKELRMLLQRTRHGEYAIEDEMNACLLTGLPDITSRSARSLKPLQGMLQALFHHFFGYTISALGSEVHLAKSVIPLSYRRFTTALRAQRELWEI